MKKIILFIAFSIQFFFPVYSQLNTQPEFSNKIEGISVYQNHDPFYQATVFDFSAFLKDSVFSKKIFIPKIPDIQLFLGRYSVVSPNYYYIQKSFNNMPCLKPVGIFLSDKKEHSEPLDKYPLLISD